jgi:myotubularin-related protein 6/7/8
VQESHLPRPQLEATSQEHFHEFTAVHLTAPAYIIQDYPSAAWPWIEPASQRQAMMRCPSNVRAESLQVEDVTLSRRGDQVVGTIHLTPHHIIFVHTPVTDDDNARPPRPRELWITYPIISFCTLRPAPAASRQPSSIRLRCRDFTFVCFYFPSETKARDVYDSIKAWTCKLGRIEKLYAFTYQPQPPEKEISCWDFYDPMKEWRRMGVGDPSRKTKWRISNVNQDYSVCWTKR